MIKACVIPARGGSKRIPRKNIRMFHGKPLIAWSIELALESGLFQGVYVSTDDDEIKEVARSFGANVPFKRPDSLSGDLTIDKDVRKHFVDWYTSNLGPLDQLCYLYPTAPLLTTKSLVSCDDLLNKRKASMVHTVVEFEYPVMRALQMEEDSSLIFRWPEYSEMRSQDTPTYYHDAGQCYFHNYTQETVSGLVLGHEVSRLEAQDIDTLDDFRMAEMLFRMRF